MSGSELKEVMSSCRLRDQLAFISSQSYEQVMYNGGMTFGVWAVQYTTMLNETQIKIYGLDKSLDQRSNSVRRCICTCPCCLGSLYAFHASVPLHSLVSPSHNVL